MAVLSKPSLCFLGKEMAPNTSEMLSDGTGLGLRALQAPGPAPPPPGPSPGPSTVSCSGMLAVLTKPQDRNS